MSTMSRIVGDVLNVDGVMRLVVMSMRDNLVGSLGLFALKTVGDEEDSCKNEGNLGGSEGLESDELNDEELAEQHFGTDETDDSANTASPLLLTTTWE